MKAGWGNTTHIHGLLATLRSMQHPPASHARMPSNISHVSPAVPVISTFPRNTRDQLLVVLELLDNVHREMNTGKPYKTCLARATPQARSAGPTPLDGYTIHLTHADRSQSAIPCLVALCMNSCPLSSSCNGLRFVLLPVLGNIVCKRIIWVWST